MLAGGFMVLCGVLRSVCGGALYSRKSEPQSPGPLAEAIEIMVYKVVPMDIFLTKMHRFCSEEQLKLF